MECNREEACRAKEIAEKKFMARDIEGSYKFAAKAYKLYPSLEGLSQMITAIEVHLAANTKLCNSQLMDWYAILQVSSSSHLAVIKQQYKKLALLLHPDKNKSLGAEGAFKLIREAWGVLADESKKNTYDSMRKGLVPQKQHPNVTTSFNSTTSTSPKAQTEGTSTHTHVNINAQTSGKSFTPIPASANMGSSLDTPTIANCFTSNTPHTTCAASHLSPEKTPAFWAACSSCKMLQMCPRSQEIQCSNCRIQFVAVEVATMSMSVNGYTRKRIIEENVTTTGDNVMDGHEPKENFRELAEDHSKKPENSSNSKKPKKGTKKTKNESKKRKKLSSVLFEEDPSVKIVNPICIDVIDPDFNNFDQDRIEVCFEENQIWAIYDDDDGMPRYYALINKVVSFHPFKVQMSWLDRKDNDEDLIKWANAGFCRTCGEFEVGRKTSTEFLNVFSHVMKGEKSVAGNVKIFPRKGSVWALYRDWQSDWDGDTPQEYRHKYEIVEVITDFTETLGGSVVPLVKLDGFKTVYQKKQIGSQAVRWVLKTEFLRFSHQIPAQRLLGSESQHLPKGCWELDPAATPRD